MALPPPAESGWEVGTRHPSSTGRQPPPSSPLPWKTTWPLASSPAVLGSLGRVTAITILGTGLKIRRARRAAGHGGARGHAGPHGAKGAAAPLPAGDGDRPGDSQGRVCPGRGSALTRYRRKRVRKGKDRCKAWKRRILPGCQPLAPLLSLPRCRRPTEEPAHRRRGSRSPFIGATEMSPGLDRPTDPPGAGRGFGLSVGRTRAVALPLLPSGSRSSGRPALPFPNATGPGRGVAAGRAGGHSPGWSRFPGTPRWQRGSVPAACPQRCPGGLFSAGLGRAPKGPGSHQCPAFSLVRRSPAAGSPDPRSHCHGNSPRPWETLPGLSFPPRKQGGREAEETSGSLLPNRGHRHDARAMGTAGGVSGSVNISAAQLPDPTGLCRGAPPAPWGSLPFPGGTGTQPQQCCPPAGSPGRTAGHAGSHSVREERPTATSCHSPRLPDPPKPWPLLCHGGS